MTKLLWHKNCFSAFTSSTNLSNLSTQSNKDDTLSSPSSSRAPRKALNFKELCFLCDQKSYKNDKKLFLVSTFKFGETLKRRVEEKSDFEMIRRVGGDFRKLVALNARYHKCCHSKYTVEEKKNSEQPIDPHSAAFMELLDTIQPELEKGKAIGMDTALSCFQAFLMKYISKDEAMTYTRQKLKLKIESKCSDLLQIQNVGSNKPDMIVSKGLKIQDIINKVAEMKEMLANAQAQANIEVNNNDVLMLPELSLFYAALIIRSSIKKVEGLKRQPLKPADINMDNAETLIPDGLYTFIGLFRISLSSRQKLLIRVKLEYRIHLCIDKFFSLLKTCVYVFFR